MEKDIGRIKKNEDTEIVVRIDDFGGNVGLTIREFVKSEKYTGFTKSGVRINGDKFADFKKMIDSIHEKDFVSHGSGEGKEKHEGNKEKKKFVAEKVDDVEF